MSSGQISVTSGGVQVKNETAKEYLERHNLHILFEHMAYKVLSDRPDDPSRYLFDYLATRIGVDTRGIHSHGRRSPDYKIVFVLGGPGSGKGTQCEKLVEAGYCICVSSGETLRREVAKGSPEGKAVEADLKAGRLAPRPLILAIIKKWIHEQPKGSVLLLDGFPRDMGQALAFESEIQPCEFALYFNASDEVLEKRLGGRGREDDTPGTIKNRLKVFHGETQPVVDYYGALGKLREIDANRSTDEIFLDAVKYFIDLKKESEAGPRGAEHGTSSSSTSSGSGTTTSATTTQQEGFSSLTGNRNGGTHTSTTETGPTNTAETSYNSGEDETTATATTTEL